MEPIEKTDNSPDLHLTEAGINQFERAIYWARLIAIIGSIALIGIVIYTVAITFFFNSNFGISEASIALMTLGITILIYGAIVYYLWNFAKNGKAAVLNNDNMAFGHSVKFLGFFFRLIGILIIIGLISSFIFGGLGLLFTALAGRI